MLVGDSGIAEFSEELAMAVVFSHLDDFKPPISARHQASEADGVRGLAILLVSLRDQSGIWLLDVAEDWHAYGGVVMVWALAESCRAIHVCILWSLEKLSRFLNLVLLFLFAIGGHKWFDSMGLHGLLPPWRKLDHLTA